VFFAAAAALGIAFPYVIALTYAVAYAAISATPVWWFGPFAAQGTASLSWVLGSHALAELIASLPIAALVIDAFRQCAIGAAVAIAVIVLVTVEMPIMSDFRSSSTLARGATLLEAIEMHLSLPASVWLLRLLPSDDAYERTVLWHRKPWRDRAAAQRER